MLKCLFLTLILLTTTSIRAIEVDSLLKSSCFVNNGSGVVYFEDDSRYWILTAGHVVCPITAENKKGIPNKTVRVSFHHKGHKSHQIIGRVTKCFYVNSTLDQIDVAYLYILKKDMGTYPHPQPCFFDNAPSVGDSIYTAGAPSTERWMSIIKGHVTNKKDFVFTYAPLANIGRSGSGVFNEQGNLIGIIARNDLVERTAVVLTAVKIRQLADK